MIVKCFLLIEILMAKERERNVTYARILKLSVIMTSMALRIEHMM